MEQLLPHRKIIEAKVNGLEDNLIPAVYEEQTDTRAGWRRHSAPP